MTTPANKLGFSADDYLAWEERQQEKHEYVRGEVFAMVGPGVSTSSSPATSMLPSAHPIGWGSNWRPAPNGWGSAPAPKSMG